MKKRKKINLSRIVWVTGVFMILIIVLIMVVIYKVRYEGR